MNLDYSEYDNYASLKRDDLADCVRHLCRERGICLYRLEQALLFGNGTIGKWKTAKPRPESLKRVADYFGITVDELRGLEEKDPASAATLTERSEGGHVPVDYDRRSDPDRKLDAIPGGQA